MSEDIEGIFEAFKTAFENDLGEDEVKLEMISAGATFKNVTRLYNQFMVDAGYAMSKEDRDEILDEILGGIDLSTEESFDACIAEAVEKITGADEKSATTYIRSWAKKNEVKCYTKPKSQGNGGNRNPFVTLFHESLIANPKMTEAELKALIEGLEPDHQVNPMRWFTQHNKIRQVVNAVAEKAGL